MKEFVTANGSTFACADITTGINSITFTMQNQDADELESFFRDVTELTVTYEGEEKPHGTYKDLKYKSITKYEDGSVSVTMRIKDETEKRLDALEASQEIQNGAIMELAQSVGGEA